MKMEIKDMKEILLMILGWGKEWNIKKGNGINKEEL